MNWSLHDDPLIRRGYILLYFSVLDGQDHEVELMIAKRRDRPLIHPGSLNGLLASIKLLFNQSYERLDGTAVGLSKYVEGLIAPHYGHWIGGLTIDEPTMP